MLMAGGYEIARAASIPWEDRVNVDGWPSRAGMYYNDTGNNLCMRLIDYPVGSTEPRHVHGGTHATTVLKGTTIVDGLTLGPLDVILGPSNEPHGPLFYPQGCQLFSAFQGSYFHSEVETLHTEKQYRLVQAGEIAWVPAGDGIETKTLVDHGCGRLLLEALRAAPGAQIRRPAMLAGIVVEGEVTIENERLGPWDFFYVRGGGEHAPLRFTQASTLLTVTLR
jgi:quercetin dioxygenase-like cupin family protein